MNQLDIKDIGPLFIGTLKRFHVVLFAVVALCGIAVLIYSAYQIVITAIDPGEPTTSVQAAFDQETINRLESLSQKSGTSRSLDFPDNQRINPFSE